MIELLLIALLGHHNYNIREQTQTYLKKEGYTGYLLVIKFTKIPDQEINRRCKEIISHYLHMPPCLTIGIYTVKFHNGKTYDISKGYWKQELHKLQKKYHDQNYSLEDRSRMIHAEFLKKLLKAGAVKKDLLSIINTVKPEPIKPPEFEKQ